MVKFVVALFIIFVGLFLFSLTGIGNPINYPVQSDLVKPWWIDVAINSLGQFPDINAWLFAVMGFISVTLRATAEILGFISQKTATKKDDKVYKTINNASFYTGQVVGWFGAGKPKQIDKAKEVRLK